ESHGSGAALSKNEPGRLAGDHLALRPFPESRGDGSRFRRRPAPVRRDSLAADRRIRSRGHRTRPAQAQAARHRHEIREGFAVCQRARAKRLSEKPEGELVRRTAKPEGRNDQTQDMPQDDATVQTRGMNTDRTAFLMGERMRRSAKIVKK